MKGPAASTASSEVQQRTSTDNDGTNMPNRITIPKLEPLDLDIPDLARIFAGTSWFPDPDTVRNIGRAVFPTVRASNKHPRFSTFANHDGEIIGMYDDNTTPRWAILWSHGIVDSQRAGWMFAHVWPIGGDIHAYTHLANIAMVPEYFGALTDKNGPLTAFLRWHAWSVYKFKPEGISEPQEPYGYDRIQWRYFKGAGDPKELVRERMERSDNQRLRVLRPIMENLKYLD